MSIDIEAVMADADLKELRGMLRRAAYSTDSFRTALAIADPADAILANTGRYSMLYLSELVKFDSPASILAQLFMLCGRVPKWKLEHLEPVLARMLVQLRLIETVADDPELVRGTVAITELNGLYFLSDTLFENNVDDFIVHDEAGRCMPPHASSLELLHALRKPAGAKSFLDIGCGTGCQSLLFAARYERAVGFDSNPRAVQFAQANSALNGRTARYAIGHWETYADGERYDHVTFNAGPAAIDFVNYGLSKLLAPGGSAQVWCQCEITQDDGTLNRVLERRLLAWDDLAIEVTTNPDSPFALSRQSIADKRLPYGTLVISHPSQKMAFFRDLAARSVTEIASVNLTIRCL